MSCEKCTTHPGERVIRDEYTYTGSCLGPFKVKGAVIFECRTCGNVRILASIAKGWEIEKAVELIENKSFFNPTEMIFLRQHGGLTRTELAVALDVEGYEVLRWEQGLGATPHESRLMMRHMIEKVIDMDRLCVKRADRIRKKARMETMD